MKNFLRWLALPFASVGATLLVSLIGYWLSCTDEGIPDIIKLLTISGLTGYVFSYVSKSVAPSRKKISCIVMTFLLCLFFILFGFCDVFDMHIREKVGGFGVFRWIVTMISSIVTTVVFVKEK